MHVLLWHLIQLFKKDQVKNSAVVRCGNESEITQLPWAPTLLCDQGMKEHTRCPGDDRGGQPPCCSLFLGPLRGVAGSAGNKSQVPPSLVFSESPGVCPSQRPPLFPLLVFTLHFSYSFRTCDYAPLPSVLCPVSKLSDKFGCFAVEITPEAKEHRGKVLCVQLQPSA